MLRKIIIPILIVTVPILPLIGYAAPQKSSRRINEVARNTPSRISLITNPVGQLSTQVSKASARANPQEIRSDLIEDAGQALVNFRNNYYLAFLTTIGGYVLLFGAAAMYPPNAILAYTGSIMVLAGIVWQFLTFNSIGVAGQRLKRAVR